MAHDWERYTPGSDIPCIVHVVDLKGEDLFFDCTNLIKDVEDPRMLLWSEYTPKQRNIWKFGYFAHKSLSIALWINTYNFGPTLKQELFHLREEYYDKLVDYLKQHARLMMWAVANDPIVIKRV